MVKSDVILIFKYNQLKPTIVRIRYNKLRNNKVKETYNRLLKVEGTAPHIMRCYDELPLVLCILNVIEARRGGLNPIVAINDFSSGRNNNLMLAWQYSDVKRTNRLLYFRSLLYKPNMSKKYLRKSK